MRISVNYADDGTVFQHFGKTQVFKLYDVEDGKVTSTRMLPAVPGGHGALPFQLKDNGVDVVICGGMGAPMLQNLQSCGFQICANVSGDADAAVQAYLDGTLEYGQEAHACHH